MLKKTLIALPLLALVPLEAFPAGIPVFDAAAVSQSLQSFIQLTKEYEALLMQYDQQVETFRSISGTRGLGALLWDSRLRSLMPEDVNRVLSDVERRGASALTPEARRILDGYGLLERCAAMPSSEKALCEKAASAAAQSRAFFESAERTASERSSRIEGLLRAIDAAADQKAISDLSARINAETAALSAEKIRLDALRKITDENRELLRLEREKEAAKRWAVPGSWSRYLE